MPRRKKAPLDPKRAILYIRASTREQKLSPDAQRAAAQAWCATHGAEIVAEYVDLGVSGGLDLQARTGLLRAVSELKTHQAGVLLVACRDRLARDYVVAGLVQKMVEAQGATVVSADNNGNASKVERAIRDVLADDEKDRIRERTRNALAVRKARGERWNREAPYGYKISEDGRHVEPEPTEQRAVARIQALHVRGATLREIVRHLEAEGHTPRGVRWYPMSVKRVLDAT